MGSISVDIPTARGDVVSSDRLGPTLMHEHVFLCDHEVNISWPDTFGNVDHHVANAVEQLNALAAAGIRTITDVTAIGHGRDVARVARVARETEVNILVATGIYVLAELPSYFRLFGPGSFIEAPETMTDYFVRDIEEGIGETGVRASILKVATGHAGLTNDVLRCLRSVAAAHRRTGVPITTHTSVKQNGRDQQRIFEEEGVDLSRVVIGHVDSTADGDLGYVEELLDKGSFVGFDSFALPLADLDTKVELMAKLIARGHGNRIVVSHDHACFVDFMPKEYQGDFYRKTYFTDVVEPRLLAAGVSEAQVRALTVDNPRAVFETTARGAY
ncbi:phosphotriesterase [Amycolatopsis deserti]|uniref:Phosphotriesterase n=1 Tax=Amycolatopsis deserti TaxID=185696 RepID=A0ABQ3IDT9_9PSEU|nr:phosphotriesterase-related protein [Amycolatopsis deserti]GHE80600.1 phosphotriesterase [Amycolatopsis deserti]